MGNLILFNSRKVESFLTESIAPTALNAGNKTKSFVKFLLALAAFLRAIGTKTCFLQILLILYFFHWMLHFHTLHLFDRLNFCQFHPRNIHVLHLPAERYDHKYIRIKIPLMNNYIELQTGKKF